MLAFTLGSDSMTLEAKLLSPLGWFIYSSKFEICFEISYFKLSSCENFGINSISSLIIVYGISIFSSTFIIALSVLFSISFFIFSSLKLKNLESLLG